MLKQIFLSVVAVLILAGTAMAGHPLVTDDTGTQGKEKFQLEMNAAVSRDKEVFDGVVIRESSAEMAMVFSAGLTDSVDLVIGAPWVWSRLREDGVLTSDEHGIGDLSVEIKWRFFEHDGFSLAVKPGMTLPTGNEHRGLGNGKTSYGVTMIASQKLAPFALHANAAYSRNEFKLDADKEVNRHDIWHGSVAVTCEVVKDLQVAANFGMESNGEHGADTWPAFILGGVIYAVTENLDLDMGLKGGLNGPEADLAYMAGVAYRF